MRYRLHLGWKGTKYLGWQRLNGLKDKSVQARLENVTKMMNKDRSPALVKGTSRTDSGVHAINAIAQVNWDNITLDEEGIKKALNYHLKNNNEQIWINNVEKVADDWNCRNNEAKRYIYRIAWNSNRSLAEMEEDSVWHLPMNLNLDEMNIVCQLLTGTHDFSGFSQARSTDIKKVKTIRTFDIIKRTPSWYGEYIPGVQYADFIVEGNGFLYRQVRKMVGAAIAVGNGNINIQTVKNALETKDSSLIPLVAPSHGLYLAKIYYKE